jgi:hypothetical protein
MSSRSVEDARRIAVMGGHATKGQFRLMLERNCNHNCSMFGKCFASPLSANYGGKCALARLPQSMGQRTVKTILGGEKGFVENMIELISEIEMKARGSGSIDELHKLLDKYLKVHPALFGTKTKIETNQPLTFNDIDQRIINVIQAPKIDAPESISIHKDLNDTEDGQGQ